MNITDLDICSVCKHCSVGRIKHFVIFSSEATCSRDFPFNEINSYQNGISHCDEFDHEYRNLETLT